MNNLIDYAKLGLTVTLVFTVGLPFIIIGKLACEFNKNRGYWDRFKGMFKR